MHFGTKVVYDFYEDEDFFYEHFDLGEQNENYYFKELKKEVKKIVVTGGFATNPIVNDYRNYLYHYDYVYLQRSEQ